MYRHGFLSVVAVCALAALHHVIAARAFSKTSGSLHHVRPLHFAESSERPSSRPRSPGRTAPRLADQISKASRAGLTHLRTDSSFSRTTANLRSGSESNFCTGYRHFTNPPNSKRRMPLLSGTFCRNGRGGPEGAANVSRAERREAFGDLELVRHAVFEVVARELELGVDELGERARVVEQDVAYGPVVREVRSADERRAGLRA